MASTNIYEKRYLTKPRRKTDDNVYMLIFFKCDNTFIIKKKSNVHGIAENGLVTIKDRNKSYVGCSLFEGSFADVEAAAERLDKQMNTDIESDCEGFVKTRKLNKQQELSQSSISTTPKTSTIVVDRPSTTKNNSMQKKSDKDSSIQSLAMISFDSISKVDEASSTSDKVVKKKSVHETSRHDAYKTLRDVQYLSKEKDSAESDTSEETLSSDDNEDNYETEDDNNSTETTIGVTKSLALSKLEESNNVKQQQSKQFSSNGSKTTSQKTISKRFCSKQLFPSNSDGNQDIMKILKALVSTNKNLASDMKLLVLDVKQLYVLTEKLDGKLNLLFENQKKIQRVLAKRKINVALCGGDFDTEHELTSDIPYQHSLIFQTADGSNVDLLQLYGVRTQIGRFVALVMDHVFTKHELCTMETNDLIKDERYSTIKEAVRSRFKLSAEEMNTEWPTIHESILQKRRNERKRKTGPHTVKDSDASLQSANYRSYIDQ